MATLSAALQLLEENWSMETDQSQMVELKNELSLAFDTLTETACQQAYSGISFLFVIISYLQLFFKVFYFYWV